MPSAAAAHLNADQDAADKNAVSIKRALEMSELGGSWRPFTPPSQP